MGTLDAAESAIFEDHYITCSRCAAIVEETDAFIRAMQGQSPGIFVKAVACGEAATPTSQLWYTEGGSF